MAPDTTASRDRADRLQHGFSHVLRHGRAVAGSLPKELDTALQHLGRRRMPGSEPALDDLRVGQAGQHIEVLLLAQRASLLGEQLAEDRALDALVVGERPVEVEEQRRHESRIAHARRAGGRAALARATRRTSRRSAAGSRTTTSRSYVDGEALVLRIGGKDTDLLGIDRRARARGRARGRAPRHRPGGGSRSSSGGLLVTRFVEGEVGRADPAGGCRSLAAARCTRARRSPGASTRSAWSRPMRRPRPSTARAPGLRMRGRAGARTADRGAPRGGSRR